MKKIYLTIILGIFLLLGSVSALDNYPTIKQNDCINLQQICASCSYVNISSISNRENYSLISNVEMNYYGNGEWRYEFCNTSFIGEYDVKGQGDINGVDEGFATRFEVTPTGIEGNLGFYIILLILSLRIIILGFVAQDTWVAILGSFGLIIMGLFMLLYGINGMKDVVYTYSISIITIMLGAYIGIRAAVETLE